MKRLITALLLVLAFTSVARAEDWEVSVVATTNVLSYKLYSDAFPAGHAGPGEGKFMRVGKMVLCTVKLDVQPIAAGQLTILQLTTPYPFHSVNYSYEVGIGTNPGSQPSGAIFGSQTTVEGNNTTVVFKFIPIDGVNFRAYALMWMYEADE